jgi:hypothetical protein
MYWRALPIAVCAGLLLGVSGCDTNRITDADKGDVLLPTSARSVVGKSGIERTVGLLHKSTGQRGYMLYSPFRRTDVFLVDMNGKLVHKWDSPTLTPGASVQLTDDGTLLRASRNGCAVFLNPWCDGEPHSFAGGGRGGLVEEFSWDGEKLWEYEHHTTTERQHHEALKLPNGNVLMAVWSLKDEAAQLAAGRTTPITSGNPAGLWAERIIELDPDELGSGNEIVWEWDVWDHLVQNQNPTLQHYGDPADHPDRIDVNLGGANSWLHFNSLDYNPELDQILVSANGFSEIFIIDRATGEIVFRWGNPPNHGSSADQRNFNQHNAKWVGPDQPGTGAITFFHNNGGASEAVLIEPVWENGAYQRDPGTGAYLPLDATSRWSVPAGQGSFIVSSAQFTSNGTFFVTAGIGGRTWQVNKKGEVNWVYVNPAVADCTRGGCVPDSEYYVEQGVDPDPNNWWTNLLFRALLYEEDHPGLVGKDLTHGFPVEAPPLTYLRSAATELDALLSGGDLGALASAVQAARDAVGLAETAGDAGEYADLLAGVHEAIQSLKPAKNHVAGVAGIMDKLQYVADWNTPN